MGGGQYRGRYNKYRGDILSTVGCSAPWGIMINVGDILSTVRDAQYRGGYHEYRGGVQYRGGYHVKCGGYLEYRGGVQYRGGYHDKCGGYLEYRGGCSVPWGDIMMHVGIS